MIYDIKDIDDTTLIYKLMSQTIIPRPIAWAVTKNSEVINIAPFSYFMALSSNPATCIVSIGKKKSLEPKDTLKNILETKSCTICLPEVKDLEKLHYSSKALDANISEAKEFNIQTEEIFSDFPPVIKDTPVAYFCTFNQLIKIGGKTTPIILNIEHIYLREDIIKDKKSAQITYSPLGRLGKSYCTIGDILKAPDIP
jgi:flavin reductase (DIM6/NTAB) family NADH-FMN oxidoreductase RutF